MIKVMFVCLGNIKNIVGEDKEKKIYKLLDFSNNPRDIAVPWYTGNFEITYNNISEECTNFYKKEKNMYFNEILHNNNVYSVDKLRLKTFLP